MGDVVYHASMTFGGFWRRSVILVDSVGIFARRLHKIADLASEC